MKLAFVHLENFTTHSGKLIPKISLSYECFGDFQKLQNHGVLALHALTGNSHVAGDSDGWWFEMIGEGKTIDTQNHPVLCFNIPGNGFDQKPENLIDNYQDFNTHDVAKLFLLALQKLGITKMHCVFGASLGGAILWEMAVLAPDFFAYHVPVCSHYQSTDWVIAHNHIQLEILHSKAENSLELSRMLAMMFYRTPMNFDHKFGRSLAANGSFNVTSYLNYQGKKLANRFTKKAYLLMTHLLSSIDITQGEKFELKGILSKIKGEFLVIGIEPDFLFPSYLSQNAQKELESAGVKSRYVEIKTRHGHDSFFIEYDQLKKELKPIFESK